METILNLFIESWTVLSQMAPYLLFGFLMAGILSVFIEPSWVEQNLGGKGFWPVFKASLIGVPMPLCSCGVLPVSASLRKHGASKASTTSFLLSTPQTGVDSIAITYALLGPVFAVFRPFAALLTGFLGGILVQFFDKDNGETRSNEKDKPEHCKSSCCSGKKKINPLIRALRYGLITLPLEIGPSLLLGILIAGAMSTFIQEKSLATYIGGGILSIFLMMAAGVPVYVCATASVPIAAGFMHAGASPGAALAFLIAGPATNAASFTTIWKVLGKQTALLYLATVAASAFGLGLLLDWIIPLTHQALPETVEHSHSTGIWFNSIPAVVLLFLIAFSFLRKLISRHSQKKQS